MVDYAPIIPPAVTWSNSWSVAFIDLLSIVAAAKVVAVVDPYGVPTVITVTDGVLGVRAKQLLTRELVARLASGSAVHEPDWDPLIDSSSIQIGPSIADDFAARATAVLYRPIGGSWNRFSIPVPRNGVPDTPDFVQADTVAKYASELAAVLAAWPPLMADLAAQAARNTAQDSTAATAAAAALATSRANYVTTLATAWPLRGFA